MKVQTQHHVPVLQTARLVLEPASPVRANTLANFYRRNQAFHGPWEPTRPQDWATAPRQRGVLQACQKAMEQGNRAVWLLFAQNRGEANVSGAASVAGAADAGEKGAAAATKPDATAQVLGRIALSNIVRGAFHSAHLSYSMDEAHARKGLATEALEAIVAWAFGPANLHRIEANLISENTASKNLVRKLGFRCEGVSPDYLRIGGRWRDHEHWVRLNAEWKES